MDENNGYKEKVSIHERLSCLETQMDTVLTNHLPHLQRGVDEMNAKFWGIIILLIANLVAILAEKI